MSIVAFEKRRNPLLAAAEQEYLKRLTRYAEVEELLIRKWDQSTGLSAPLLRNSYRVGLFVEAKRYSSEELAERLQQLMNQGSAHLVLVIGAADGMPPGTAAQLTERWSLSRLTFGHQLTRLILLEALYRSFDILHGGRYHK